MERSEYRVADPDTNLLYVFDGNGRHLQTDNVITGATMYTFSYSTKGKLITVSDVNRNDLIIDYSKVRGYCFTQWHPAFYYLSIDFHRLFPNLCWLQPNIQHDAWHM